MILDPTRKAIARIPWLQFVVAVDNDAAVAVVENAVVDAVGVVENAIVGVVVHAVGDVENAVVATVVVASAFLQSCI